MSTTPSARSNPGQRSDRLESWKEIALYLNRTVRTAQRWEQTEGLPVHRHSHEKRDSVYALPSELDEWLSARRLPLEGPEPGEATPDVSFVPLAFRPRVARRMAVLVASAVVLAALGAAGWRYWSGSRPVLPFAPSDWVVLADFQNQTGEPLVDHGLGTAFAVSLEQSRHANLLPRTRLEAALRRMAVPAETKIDERIGREVCIREGANALILPTISKVGGRYAVSARLIDVKTGGSVAAYLEHAAGQDKILNALGKVAAQIRRDLGESLASIRRNNEPLPQVTTPSLEALRAYADGVSLWNRGQYDHAVDLYRAALKHDPDFAMAHAALGGALLSHIYRLENEGQLHYERARQLAERITERERLLIEARYHAGLRHIEGGSEAYRTYLAAYPDDFSARASFAYFLMVNERPEEAVSYYRDVIRASPSDSSALINIATSYVLLSRPGEALQYYERAFGLDRTWLTIRNINHEYGFALATSGNPGKAREVFTQAAAAPQIQAGGLRSLALLSMWEGKYRAARELLTQAIALNNDKSDFRPSARNHLFLAILLAGRGDNLGAQAELDHAAGRLRQTGELVIDTTARVGVMCARTGAVGKAVRILAGLAPRMDRQAPALMAEWHLLESEIALARGENERAIGLLVQAHREVKSPLPLAALARAYDRAGRIEQAIACYEALIAKAARAAGWEPQQDALEAHARLAELHLERGDSANAARVLEPIAKLWSAADPDLPLSLRIERLKAALR